MDWLPDAGLLLYLFIFVAFASFVAFLLAEPYLICLSCGDVILVLPHLSLSLSVTSSVYRYIICCWSRSARERERPMYV